MYQCRYCGFVSYNEHVNYCATQGCPNYRSLYKNDYMPSADSPPKCEVSSMHQLSFATVPFQKFNGIMPPRESLAAGTVFGELSMPYTKKIIRRG